MFASPEMYSKVSKYFRDTFQDCFKGKVRTIEQFYLNIYEALWKYYSGVIPFNYGMQAPIAHMRNIKVKVTISHMGLTNVIITVNDAEISIGISVANHLCKDLLLMFGSTIEIGSFTTKDYHSFLMTSPDKVQVALSEEWEKWVSGPMTVIDQHATNPDVDRSVMGLFKNVHYTGVTINVNLFGVVVLTAINGLNKQSLYQNQFNKYVLKPYDKDRYCFDLILSTRAGKNIPVFLNIPIGLQGYTDIIYKNLNNLFTEIFEYYDSSDSIMPDGTIQSIGNTLFPMSKLSAKSFDIVPYYRGEENKQEGQQMNSILEALQEAKRKQTEKKEKEQEIKRIEVVQESPKVEVKETKPVEVDERTKFAKKVRSLLSGRVTEHKSFSSESSLTNYCYMAVDTVNEIRTDIEFRCNIRVFKRVDRDKYHTLNILVYDVKGILVSYSTKILLEFGDFKKKRGAVLFIDSDQSNWVHHKTYGVDEATDYSTALSCLLQKFNDSSMFTAENFNRLSITKFSNFIESSVFKTEAMKFLTKNTGHRFDIWDSTTDGSYTYIIVDVYLRIDLIKTYVFRISKQVVFNVACM